MKERFIRYMNEMELKWQEDLHFKDQYERMRAVAEEKEQEITGQTARMAELAGMSQRHEQAAARARGQLRDMATDFKARMERVQRQHESAMRLKEAEATEAVETARAAADTRVERMAAKTRGYKARVRELDDAGQAAAARAAAADRLTESLRADVRRLQAEVDSAARTAQLDLERRLTEQRGALVAEAHERTSALTARLTAAQHEVSYVRDELRGHVEAALRETVTPRLDTTDATLRVTLTKLHDAVSGLGGEAVGREAHETALLQAAHTVEAQATAAHHEEVARLTEKWGAARDDAAARHAGELAAMEARAAEEVAELRRALEDAHTRSDDARRRLAETQAAVDRYRRAAEESRAALTRAQGDHKVEMDTLRGTIEDLKRHAAGAEATADEARGEADGLRKALQRVRDEREGQVSNSETGPG